MFAASSVRREPRFRSPASPTTTLLGDGYTDEALASKYQVSQYDNHRPSSRFSQASTFGSKTRTSLGSLSELHTPPTPIVETMLQRMGSVASVVPLKGPYGEEQERGCFGKAKSFYERYNLKFYAPLLVLFLYSLIGAGLFYLVEHEYEQELIQNETLAIQDLRNRTSLRLQEVVDSANFTDLHDVYVLVLEWHEQELTRVKLPTYMPWDAWGALFYVGSVFTTIGYGNIAPRTVGGQALSVIYALIGIPLVLAILGQCGQLLTRKLSEEWVKYRHFMDQKLKKRPKGGRKNSAFESEHSKSSRAASVVKNCAVVKGTLMEAEEGQVNLMTTSAIDPNLEEEEEEQHESRTIPVWLALLLCISWVCFSAGLFLIWEKRWTFFTSLYFFFISLSTIGLGDVVPDHPRMLILMFWMVIIGLIIVSMLLSVIQIKMEEWLYSLMRRMQKEYKRALATGNAVERERLINQIMEKEPWFMRNFAPQLITEEQTQKIEQQAEQFERLIRQTNTKCVQTNEDDDVDSVREEMLREERRKAEQEVAAAQAEAVQHREVGTDQASWDLEEGRPKIDGATQCTPRLEEENLLQAAVIHEVGDTVSQATTVPLDSSCVWDRTNPLSSSLAIVEIQDESAFAMAASGTQTEIAQFQIDEIVLKLAALQQSTRLRKSASKEEDEELQEEATEADRANVMERSMLTDAIALLSRSMETEFIGSVPEGVQTDPPLMEDEECSTDPPATFNHGIQTISIETFSRFAQTDEEKRVPCVDQAMMTNFLTVCTKDAQTEEDIEPTVAAVEKLETSSEGVQTEPQSVRSRGVATEQKAVKEQNVQTDTTFYQREEAETQQKSNENPQEEREKTFVDFSTQYDIHEEVRKKETATQTPTVPHRDTEMETERSELMQHSIQTDRWDSLEASTSSSDLRLRHHRSTSSDESEVKKWWTDQEVQTVQSFPALITGSSDMNVQSEQVEIVATASQLECVEKSSQWSPPPEWRIGPVAVTIQTDPLDLEDELYSPNQRARSSSLVSIHGSCEEEEEDELMKIPKQDLVVQTDDSYLKIARRLDEYRTNAKTQFLPVMAAGPLHGDGSHSRKASKKFSRHHLMVDRPSERRGFSLDPRTSRTASEKIRGERRRFSGHNEPKQLTPMEESVMSRSSGGGSMTMSTSESHLSPHPQIGKARSMSPGDGSGTSLERKKSLPTGIPRGRVSAYIRQHERGVHNPATSTQTTFIIDERQKKGDGEEDEGTVSSRPTSRADSRIEQRKRRLTRMLSK